MCNENIINIELMLLSCCKKQNVNEHNDVKLIKVIMNEKLIIESLIDINTLNNCLFYVCFENIRFEQSSCSNILSTIVKDLTENNELKLY